MNATAWIPYSAWFALYKSDRPRRLITRNTGGKGKTVMVEATAELEAVLFRRLRTLATKHGRKRLGIDPKEAKGMRQSIGLAIKRIQKNMGDLSEAGAFRPMVLEIRHRIARGESYAKVYGIAPHGGPGLTIPPRLDRIDTRTDEDIANGPLPRTELCRSL